MIGNMDREHGGHSVRRAPRWTMMHRDGFHHRSRQSPKSQEISANLSMRTAEGVLLCPPKRDSFVPLQRHCGSPLIGDSRLQDQLADIMQKARRKSSADRIAIESFVPRNSFGQLSDRPTV